MITLLQDLVVKDFWLKLFSFVLAVLMWFTVRAIALKNEGGPIAPLAVAVPERMVLSNLPVIVMSSAEDVRSFRVNPKEVDLVLQGDAKVLKNLQKSEIRVLVDLTGIGAAHDLRKRIEVSTPAGITHVRVDPEEVQVIFPEK